MRRWWLTIRLTPFFLHAATIVRASPRSTDIGFSQQMPRTPASTASSVSRACASLGVATATTSGSASASILA